MTQELELARTMLGETTWQQVNLEDALDIDADEARQMIQQWHTQDLIQNTDEGYQFVEPSPPESPSPHTRSWSRLDIGMTIVAVIALVSASVAGSLFWMQNRTDSAAAQRTTAPTIAPTSTSTPTATPEGWHELQSAVVVYYAPGGDVAFALNDGEWYHPVARAYGTTWVQLTTAYGDFWVRSSELHGLALHEAERLADLTPPTPVVPTQTPHVVTRDVPVIVEIPVAAEPVYRQQQLTQPPAQQMAPSATPVPPQPTVTPQLPTATPDVERVWACIWRDDTGTLDCQFFAPGSVPSGYEVVPDERDVVPYVPTAYPEDTILYEVCTGPEQYWCHTMTKAEMESIPNPYSVRRIDS